MIYQLQSITFTSSITIKISVMTTYQQDCYMYWFDTNIRMWTVLTIDVDGNQIGVADYYSNRSQLIASYPQFNFKNKIN